MNTENLSYIERPTAVVPGAICEIRLAYNSETGFRDIFDDVAHCECRVLRVSACGQYAEVEIAAMDDQEIHVGRLRRVR